MDRPTILSLLARRRSDEFPHKDSPEYQYTQIALAEHSQEGQALAMRSRLVAMLLVGLFLLVIAPWPQVLYLQFMLALLALNGWIMQKIAKVGRSKAEIAMILIDLLILTMVLIGPNPLSVGDWPQAMYYRFDTFQYFFIFLAGAALAYSWRTVLTIGVWISLLWMAALGLAYWLMEPVPELTEAIYAAFPDDPDMAEELDPNNLHIEQRIQEVVVFIIVAFILAISVRRFNGLLLSNAMLARERTNLSRYFSPNVVADLSTNDEPLKRIRSHDIAVLFVDIVGFTQFAAPRRPEEVIETLREFHGLMEKSVFSNGGTLDKYLGDGLMVTFGTPEPTDQDATNALECVCDMMDALDVWNLERIAAGAPPLRVGLGVHYGPAVLADIGANRLEYAVVGNTVNIASRLEAMTRNLGARLVVSDTLIQQVHTEGGHDCLETLERHADQDIRGVEDKLTVWALPRPEGQLTA